MPSGHTDKSTINKRRPMSTRMRQALQEIDQHSPYRIQWHELSGGDRNTIRAITDRMLVIDTPEGVVLTDEARKLLREG